MWLNETGHHRASEQTGLSVGLWWELRAGCCLEKGRRRPRTEEENEQKLRAQKKMESKQSKAHLGLREAAAQPNALAS